MAKRKQKDGSGFTMSALIRQVLMDMNVHPIEEIAGHIQKFMCKTIAPEQFQIMVQRILEQDEEIQKTVKGFKLKSGVSVLDMVVDLIETVNGPLMVKDIVKKIAREQNVPPETVELDLDSDKRFKSVTYKGKPYYYLTKRKKINDKVYEILKVKNRPLTFAEIYKILETEYKLSKSEVIFLPREDAKIKRFPGSKFSLPSAKPKKKPEKPIHNVTRIELDRVIRYLQQRGEPVSGTELSEEVLKRPIKQTNLRIRLARDARVKHDGELFIIETVQEEVEIPQKVKDRVEGQYFKVKARLVGSQEIHTTDQLLDRIYKINISHMEYEFYRDLLLDHLLKDEGVVRTQEGWVQVEADKRVKWERPSVLSKAAKPDPEPEIQVAALSQTDQQFLGLETDQMLSDEEKGSGMRHHVTVGECQSGAIQIPQLHTVLLPAMPQYYEIVIIHESSERAYTAFVNRKQSLIINLENFFEDHLSAMGGILEIWQSPKDPFSYIAEIVDESGGISLSARRQTQLSKMSAKKWVLDALVKAVMKGHRKAVSLLQIWFEVNAVRAVSKSELLAVIQDYDCFVVDEKLEGFYRYDESAGTGRLSVIAEEVEPEIVPDDKVDKKVDEGVPVEPTEPEVESVPEKEPEIDEPKERKKPEPVVKRKPKRRKERDEEDVPEHIRRLKVMGRRLPRLHSARSMVVKPSGSSSNAKIGAVSVGRISRQDRRVKDKRPKTTAEPVLLPVPPASDKKMEWDTSEFINPDRGAGHAELYQALEVLKAFINRPPQIRKTDGSIVIWLDKNDLAVYFRIPPENPNCWRAWIPDGSLNSVEGSQVFQMDGDRKAKHSLKGYWWCTGKYKGPKGNWKDNNIIEGFQIIGKILELMDKPKK
jgi:hypothetical protein